MHRGRDPLVWLTLCFLLLVVGIPYSQPIFHWLFPELLRPVYQQETFVILVLVHLWLVALSSLFAIMLGVGTGIIVTRPWGREFRPLAETVAAAGQTFPPVAVLAVMVPVLGFGQEPALIALTLYGLLPVLQGTLAGMSAVPDDAKEAATGMGMGRFQILRRVECPLAAPVILAGIRTSVIVNIGTATLASTVGVSTLGMPIVIGLSGFNTAYIIQGAVLVALLAIIIDRAFERLERRFTRFAK